MGADVNICPQFILNGILANIQDTLFHAITDKWPIFSFTNDLVPITSATNPVVFAMGLACNPVIQYIIANDANQDHSLYFWSQYGTVADSVVCLDIHSMMATSSLQQGRLLDLNCHLVKFFPCSV